VTSIDDLKAMTKSPAKSSLDETPAAAASLRLSGTASPTSLYNLATL
jgi:hypothetical protein